MKPFAEHNLKRDASNTIRQVRGAWPLPSAQGLGDEDDIADRIRDFVVSNADQLGINNQDLDLEVISSVNTHLSALRVFDKLTMACRFMEPKSWW